MNISTVETDYDSATELIYDLAEPCKKTDVKALATRFLPPLYSLVFIVGVVGNFMVVLILVKYKRLITMTNIYLLSLAFSDLLFLFTFPFWIHSELKGDWIFGNGMCKLLSCLHSVGLFSGIFIIILLTIDRYLAVVHAVFALKVRTVTVSFVSSAVAWILAGFTALPDFIFQKTQTKNLRRTCSLYFPHDTAETWKYLQALKQNILGFALPLLVMVVCYTGIIKRLLRQRGERKVVVVRLIFVIMLIFFIFWTPYNLVHLIFAFQEFIFENENECERSNQLDIALQVTEVIAFTHCCANPVIYAFVGERFRKYLCHFFQRHIAANLCKLVPFSPGKKLERTCSGIPSTGEQELLSEF
ncbi:C-C chemokine receptor type 1-like [Ornithorhynchus anatinus]|uniref:C-C motif chemokine receptor 1 n=1 Tax=Ornithorhynchus anatinus TaxID=9258 RepID=F6X7T2_ORNAN|nr:C-C chemokine receptor type 1-like [Ornithorhynchus anatinus]